VNDGGLLSVLFFHFFYGVNFFVRPHAQHTEVEDLCAAPALPRPQLRLAGLRQNQSSVDFFYCIRSKQPRCSFVGLPWALHDGTGLLCINDSFNLAVGGDFYGVTLPDELCEWIVPVFFCGAVEVQYGLFIAFGQVFEVPDSDFRNGITVVINALYLPAEGHFDFCAVATAPEVGTFCDGALKCDFVLGLHYQLIIRRIAGRELKRKGRSLPSTGATTTC